MACSTSGPSASPSAARIGSAPRSGDPVLALPRRVGRVDDDGEVLDAVALAEQDPQPVGALGGGHPGDATVDRAQPRAGRARARASPGRPTAARATPRRCAASRAGRAPAARARRGAARAGRSRPPRSVAVAEPRGEGPVVVRAGRGSPRPGRRRRASRPARARGRGSGGPPRARTGRRGRRRRTGPWRSPATTRRCSTPRCSPRGGRSRRGSGCPPAASPASSASNSSRSRAVRSSGRSWWSQ